MAASCLAFSRVLRGRLLALLGALLIFSGCQTFREQGAKERSFENLKAADRAPAEAVVRRALERTVTIRPGFLMLGSGCVVTADGWILTAEHVVRGARQVEVELPDGTRREGRVVAISGGNDYALVKIDARDLKYFKLGHRPKMAACVVATGTPTKWVEPNASAGYVIYPQVRIPGEYGTYYYDAIFHSAPIFPGDSGGPLVDLAGDLVGVHGGFASEGASVAAAAAEIMGALPGGGRKKLALDLFPPEDPGDPTAPIIWPARFPRDFAESSAWTILSVETTLAAIAVPRDPELVHRLLAETRERFVAARPKDGRGDDELVRAMLGDIFRTLNEREQAYKRAQEEEEQKRRQGERLPHPQHSTVRQPRRRMHPARPERRGRAAAPKSKGAMNSPYSLPTAPFDSAHASRALRSGRAGWLRLVAAA